MTSVSNKKHRLPLFLLLVIFIFPMIAGWLLFHYSDHFHFKTTNHGVLIKPAIVVHNDELLGKEKAWHVMYVFSNCHDQCKKMQNDLTQIQKALGKDRDRIRVVFVDEKKFQNTSLAKELVGALSEQSGSISNKIYLIDPLNNAFMYYQDTTNPMDILKDLKKVLEVSQIG